MQVCQCRECNHGVECLNIRVHAPVEWFVECQPHGSRAHARRPCFLHLGTRVGAGPCRAAGTLCSFLLRKNNKKTPRRSSGNKDNLHIWQYFRRSLAMRRQTSVAQRLPESLSGTRQPAPLRSRARAFIVLDRGRPINDKVSTKCSIVITTVSFLRLGKALQFLWSQT